MHLLCLVHANIACCYVPSIHDYKNQEVLQCVCMNKPNCTANGRLGDGDIEDKTDVVKYLIMFRTWLAAMQEKLP